MQSFLGKTGMSHSSVRPYPQRISVGPQYRRLWSLRLWKIDTPEIKHRSAIHLAGRQFSHRLDEAGYLTEPWNTGCVIISSSVRYYWGVEAWAPHSRDKRVGQSHFHPSLTSADLILWEWQTAPIGDQSLLHQAPPSHTHSAGASPLGQAHLRIRKSGPICRIWT